MSAALIVLAALVVGGAWNVVVVVVVRHLERRRVLRRDRLRRAIIAEVSAVAWTGRDLRRRFGDVGGTLTTLEACGFVESSDGDEDARIYVATADGRAWLTRPVVAP